MSVRWRGKPQRLATFEAVHVQGAETVAPEALAAGVARASCLVSGMGADADLTSVLEVVAKR
jgi:hypothetical protein